MNALSLAGGVAKMAAIFGLSLRQPDNLRKCIAAEEFVIAQRG